MSKESEEMYVQVNIRLLRNATWNYIEFNTTRNNTSRPIIYELY